MEAYRKAQPSAFGGVPVARIRDLKTGKVWEPAKPGSEEPSDLPASDVLQWWLADGTLVTVRPSGTEPKIKFYILARTEVPGGSLEAARAESARKVKAIEADIRAVVDSK